MRIITVSALAGLTMLAACTGFEGTSSSDGASGAPRAVAILEPTEGNQTKGTVTFIQDGDLVQVTAEVTGLTPGLHGFHVHEKGDCSAPDATSAGGHFNPAGMAHGGTTDIERHAGDLGNLQADANGTAKVNFKVGKIAVNKEAVNGIVGRAVIVHADPDDLRSQPVGNAGKRVACGVIKMR